MENRLRGDDSRGDGGSQQSVRLTVGSGGAADGGRMESMKWTKRTRRRNIERVLRYYQGERNLSDLDVAVDFPVLFEIIEDKEFDFDDVVAAFDYLGADVVVVPRKGNVLQDWFSITDMPFDDGGKHRAKDGVAMKRHRQLRERGKEQ